MTSEQLTLVVAAVAAGSSLLTVAITVRSTGKTELRKWRRQEERALIARILTKVSEAQDLWVVIASEVERSRAAIDKYQREALRNVEQARTALVTVDADMMLAFAEVELVAGTRVVDCAKAMEREFEGIRHLLRSASGADDQYTGYLTYRGRVDQLRVELVDAVRRELRIERAPSVRRRVRGWRYNLSLGIGRLWYRLSKPWRVRP